MSLRVIVFLLAACNVFCQDLPGGAAHWWEQEPLRILHLVTSMGQINFMPARELVRKKAALYFNTEHLEVMNLPAGLDDEGWFFRSPLAARMNPDYLGEYLHEAKKHGGLRIIVYFDVTWFNKQFAAKHPEWLQIREDGTPLDGIFSTGTALCINSPYREWLFQVVRDLCAYPIDGIFFDGPIFYPETCFCRYCREKFKTQYGLPLPSKKERRGKAFADLMKFQAESLADALRDTRRIIKGVNPEIALYMNGGVRGANWATARFNRVLVAEQDLLGSEGGFLNGDLK